MKLAEGMARVGLAIERLSKLADGGNESLQRLSSLSSMLNEQLRRIDHLLSAPPEVVLLWQQDGKPRMAVQTVHALAPGASRTLTLDTFDGVARPPGVWVVARGLEIRAVHMSSRTQGDGVGGWLRITHDEWPIGTHLVVEVEALGGQRR